MQLAQAQRPAALYCRPTACDPACDGQRQVLTAHAGQAGVPVGGLHQEPHPAADAARQAVLDQVRKGQVGVVLVTRLSHWGRSVLDLVGSLRELHAHGVSLHVLARPQLDLAPTQAGAALLEALEALAEFETDLRGERVRRGHAAAKVAGRPIGRQTGQRPKSDRLAPRVLALAADGLSHRAIAVRIGLSKNTVAGILARARA